MKQFFFLVLLMTASQMVISRNRLPLQNWKLKTEDTQLTISVVNNQPVIYELKNRVNGWNWTPQPSPVPLINRVIIDYVTYHPDWTFQDAAVKDSSGHIVTLRFTSTKPALELLSYWRAREGCGPVENWMTIKNTTGKSVTFNYCDVISSDLNAKSDKPVKLWRFYRTPVGRSSGSLDTTVLSKYSQVVSIISNDDNQWDPERILPFEVMDVESKHGLYIGYGWDFGKFVTSTRNDPKSVNTVFSLGDLGEIREGKDKLLNIPYVFYGTYAGDVDDGSNKMKKWFWNYRMTKTLRENSNEPLVEFHIPYYDDASCAAYLKRFPLKRFGVDLIKLDIFWLLPGPASDWHKTLKYAMAWNPDSLKWPNGMTFGKMAHENNLKASVYMCNTYQGVDLSKISGREAEKKALLERYDKGWFDYWRSDFEFEALYNFQSHEGLLEVIDYMIANRHGFRWENCSGGGLKKSLDLAERMTFITTEDFARAHTFRWAYYGNSYVFNPVQLKADIGLNFGVDFDHLYESSVAYDKYVFRTGLLGAIMVCGSDTELDEQAMEVAKETWTIYQTRQRAILRRGNVYHILPYPDGVNWDGMQFFNTDINKGSVLLFKPSGKSPDSKLIRLKGLDRMATYTLTFQDRKEQNVTMKGAELMDKGIEVKGMSGNYASDIIWIN